MIRAHMNPLLVAAALFGVFTLLGNDSNAQPQPGALGLSEAVRYAVDHSPVLDSARRSARIGVFESSSALARLFPAADLNSIHGIQGQNPTLTENPWNSQLTLSITENLYDNGESWTRRKVADLNRQLSALSLLKTRERLCADIAHEFYRFSLNTKLLDVQQRHHQLLKKQFESMSSQYRQGLKTRKDYLRFRTQLQSSEIKLLNSRNLIDESRTELNRLLGAPLDREPALVLTFVPEEPKPVTPAIPLQPPAFTNHYEYRVSAIQREIDENNEALIRRKRWPEVFLSSTLNYQYSNYLGSSHSGAGDSATGSPLSRQLSWNTLLNLRYSIWDWGTRSRDASVAEERRMIGANQLTQELLKVRASLADITRQLGKSKADHELSRELLDLSKQSFAYLEEEYRQGKLSYLDLVGGFKDLLESNELYYRSYFNLMQNLAQYRYHEGTLYETLLPTK